ncbi:hypothetical protein ACOMHN_004191 [Nucella lapillus]
MLRTIVEEAFKPGFRSCGMFPLNGDVVLNALRQTLQSGPTHESRPHTSSSSDPRSAGSSGPSRSSSPQPQAGPSSTSSTGVPQPQAGPSSTSSTGVPQPQAGPSSTSSTGVPQPQAGPSSTSSTGVPQPQAGPSSTSSTGVPQPQAGPSSSSTSPHSVGIGQFFLQQVLQSQSTSATRGRSARVQRYRYGESLTEEETINRLRESQAGDKRKGKGKGKGKKTPQSESRSRSRSPISEKSDEGQAVCRRCGEPDDLNWVQCDICDEWFHIACTNITDSIDDLEDVQWICDFCCQ